MPMRYTRVGRTSYVVTAALLGVAIAFAAWRRPAETIPSPPADAGRGFEGGEGFRISCASCHPDPVPLGRTWAFPGGGRAVAALLIAGEARLKSEGVERTVRRHPTFEDLSDDRLAAIVGYVAGLSAPGERPEPATPADFAALRGR
jgi:hypothetical protein